MDELPKSDPGWRSVWRHIWPDILLPVPHFALWRMSRKGVDALTGMRALFITWLETPLLIIFVVWVIFRDEAKSGSIEPRWFVAGLAVFSLVTLALIRYFGAKRLDAGDRDKLVGSFTSVFFVRMALAQAVFLIGFVGAFVTGQWWMVLVGLPFTLVGFFIAAPTRSNLARAQEELNRQGTTLDLVQALLAKPFKLGGRVS